MIEHELLTLDWLKTSGVRIVVIIVGAFIAIRILFLLIRRIERLADDGDPNLQSRREKRAATLSLILRQITWIGISGIAFTMVLREFRLDIAPLIAGAGIVGLAVGFGAQSLVKDVISGFFILAENQFDVGDVVSGAGVSGTVERVNLRFTRLRDLDGKVHFIPNGEFRVVSNLTRGWSRAVVDVAVTYDEDVDRVLVVLGDVARAQKLAPETGGFIIEPMDVLGVESLGESSVTIRVLLKTMPGKQWPVAREFRRRVKQRFDELGIRAPVPQRVVITRAGNPDPSVAGAPGGEARPAPDSGRLSKEGV